MLQDSTTGRPIDIEITPEMIEAGEEVLTGALGGQSLVFGLPAIW